MKMNGQIKKASGEEERLVFGWASLAQDEMGQTITDADGDIIDPQALERGAYDFVLNWRGGYVNHDQDAGQVADMVESVVFTPDKCAAMGLEQPMPLGWWIGFKINDENIWQKVKSGELTMFSIGGKAKREEIGNE